MVSPIPTGAVVSDRSATGYQAVRPHLEIVAPLEIETRRADRGS